MRCRARLWSTARCVIVPVAVVGLVVCSPAAAFAAARASQPVRSTTATNSASLMTLMQAPSGLRTAVRRTLGLSTAAGSPIERAALLASDGVVGDSFGMSVAISGSTAVIGTPQANSKTGAAYIFVLTTTGSY